MTVKFLAIYSAICLVGGAASAQVLGDLVTVRSVSGQFTVRALENGASKSAASFPMSMNAGGALAPRTPQAGPAAEVRLAPAYLIVSCDRIKNAFLIDLGMRDEWSGKIDLFIKPARPEKDGTLLAAVRGGDTWRYELELPPEIKARMLVRTVVEALLVELANRDAGNQSAEIPLWLIEGLSAHLEAYNLPTFVVEPHMPRVANKVKLTEQESVRDQLRRNMPLSFDQLSWPEPDNLTGENYTLYSDCAQLLLEDLLRLPDGPRCLRAMIQQLPQHRNWQAAFLAGFRPHFAQLRDVEKWWGLACADFCGRDFTRRHGFQESWRMLQEALDVSVEVHFSPDRLPTPAEVTLEEVISEWNRAQVVPVLERCAQNLVLVRFQIAPELGPLADAYRLTLLTYLRQSQTPGTTLVYKKAACKRLRLLDERRALLRQKLASAK